jgi:hypothetical protein
MAASSKDTGTWKTVIGFNHPPGDKRAEVGDKVKDLLSTSIEPLLQMGAIEPHDATAKKLAAQYVPADDEG